ncbi:MAG TPA: methionyl-tRNA formyltransferase [Deltaproteobacteria bacterium]|nr:methionyl-tRNA formyltransferase [Deltaproteobacteria bacterium]
MRLAFMGTPDFALPTLESLLEAKEHKLSCVVTQPDKPRGRGRILSVPPVKVLAKTHGLPVFQPEKLKANEELFRKMISSDLDAVVVVAYGKMIPDEMLGIPRYGFINVHASLLPEFRGASPINRAIMSGATKTGITIMKIEHDMDAGPVYLQEEFPIRQDDDAVSLSHSLSLLGARMLQKTLSLIAADALQPVPQDDSKATYAPIIHREEGNIDWNKDVEDVHNMVRGLLPWPCAYTSLNNRMLKILKTSVTRGSTGFNPGTLIKERSSLKVACSGGFLTLHRLQLEGKNPMDGPAFACGLKQNRLVLGQTGEHP